MNAPPSRKRVPKSLAGGTKLFGRYTLTDLAIGTVPGVLVIVLLQVVLPADLTVAGVSPRQWTLPLAGVAIASGALLVYLTPTARTTAEWLGSLLRYQLRPSTHSHATATEYTQVERLYPERDAIERADGALVGLVCVAPPAMALATDAEWHQQATAFQDVLNTTVDFPIQLYATTRQFPVERHLAHYEDRLSDPDVQQRPQLGALIEGYLDWYETAQERRQTTIREHYVIVPVRPDEIRFEAESLTQKLTRLPVIGLFLKVWLAPRIEDERAALLDALDERCRLLSRGLREIDACTTHRVSASDAAALVAEFWSGEAIAYDDPDRVLRSRPLLRRTTGDDGARSAATSGASGGATDDTEVAD